MATNFPTSLDSYSTKNAGDTIDESHVNDLQDAVEALEAKVGANSSGVSSSIDYKLTRLPTQVQNWDAGSYEIRAQTFESDVATGTAPLTIASTTAVTNLNADMVDGNHATDFITTAHQSAMAQATSSGQSLSGSWQDITGATVTITTGANPVMIMAWALIYHNTTNGVVGLRVDIDGSEQIPTQVTHPTNANYPEQLTIMYRKVMSAGSHTFHLEAYGPATTSLFTTNAFIIVNELYGD